MRQGTGSPQPAAHLLTAAGLSLACPQPHDWHPHGEPALFAGKVDRQSPQDQQDGPSICLLAPHLQREWDHAANAHLGSITITKSGRKAWWRSGLCKTRQPHRWRAQISNRSVNGNSCPYDAGKAVCPCNNLAHNHSEVAEEWDCEANGERTPETVTASSNSKAAWRCRLCGQRWRTRVVHRSQGSGCPRCAREARCIQTRQPSISSGASHLVAEWDWEANETHGSHPDKVTLGSHKKVHWVLQDVCKLGLVHRWQATPNGRTTLYRGSPFPSGKAVCACNSLAVQCPEAADLWVFPSNGGLTTNDLAVHLNKVMAWRSPDGSQWQQIVQKVVNIVRRERGISQK